MLVLYFCECHFSGRTTPLLYGACSFKVFEVDLATIIILIKYESPSVTSVRESGRSREAIRPELKTFLSLHRWTWTIHEAVH